MAAQKKGLGKGLGALISATPASETGMDEKVFELDINQIEPNRQQPRKAFDTNALQELASSIEQVGILQPILVTKKDGIYKIISGERRWRAARLAKLRKVPVIVKEYSDAQAAEIALIENLQREDLNPIEEAIGYKRLIEEFDLTQDAIALKLSKSRNTISYAIGLLTLDERVQNFIIEGRLSPSHARCLITIKDYNVQFEIAEEIIDNGLNVRQTERLVKLYNDGKKNENKTSESKPKAYSVLENNLKQMLGTKVSVKDKMGKGKIEIEYYSEDELDRIWGIFKKISL